MRIKNDTIICAAMFLALAASAAPLAVSAAKERAAKETIKQAFSYAIPNVPGKSLTALIVNYGPGEKTPPHRHDGAFVVGYVLEGAVRSQVEGEAARVFKAGQSWTEKPGAHHVVSENPDEKKPAKLLAVFFADSTLKEFTRLDSAK